MMRNTVEQLPNKIAMSMQRNHQLDNWTYTQFYEDAKHVAKGLLALGLQRYDGVGIMCSNCPEWFLARYLTALV